MSTPDQGATDRAEPTGVSADAPANEGSEPTAVSSLGRGEQRAYSTDPDRGSADDLGGAEPTDVPAAGPGGAPDPAPARRPFPDNAP